MREMKDSGIEWIGSVPISWGVPQIRSMLKEIRSKNIHGAETTALQFKYGTIVQKSNFEAEEDEYVAHTIKNYTIVNPGDIILNGLNLNYDFVSQRIALVNQTGVITSAYIVFRLVEKDNFTPKYLTYLLKSYDNCKAFHNMGGGVRKILSFEELKRNYILQPSLSEQEIITAYLDQKCSEIDALSRRLQATWTL